jgi:AMMECR1 domain-containing protein
MRFLDKNTRKDLLDCARNAIKEALTKDSVEEGGECPGQPCLNEARGCYVTLKKKGRLRGDIGNIEPIAPLMDAVRRNARLAAFYDKRFSPLTLDGLLQTNFKHLCFFSRRNQ